MGRNSNSEKSFRHLWWSQVKGNVKNNEEVLEEHEVLWKTGYEKENGYHEICPDMAQEKKKSLDRPTGYLWIRLQSICDPKDKRRET